ncbi:MAG: extracellular solute-binding protein, partial [Chloroflexi bacterium]|nr:extracellular solute-binding protein [Chloroflexota bacterium]
MKPNQYSPRIIIPILLIASFAASCDLIQADQTGLQPTSGLIKTIPPATLTAISAAEKESGTSIPDPMGVPWSALEGLELDFWYIWDLDEPGAGMNAIVDTFNKENEWGIKVNPVDQGLVLDPLDSIETAFADGLVPHILISDDSAIAGWYQADLTVDLTPFMDDAAAGLTPSEQKDYYPGIFESFTLEESVRPGLPFTQSIQVLYYNQSWANELGFVSPPMTSAEFIKQSCAAADVENDDLETTGILLSPESENITSLIFAFEGSLLNPSGDGYQFSSPEALRVARLWQSLYLDSCGMMISQYPNPMASEREIEWFNQRRALMIMGSAQLMEYIQMGANQTGRADDWIMLPFVGQEGKKAVTSGIQSGVVFKTSPEEELGAWLFLKYLTSPEVQAEWFQYSFYYPTRKDSLRHLRDYRDEHPD